MEWALYVGGSIIIIVLAGIVVAVLGPSVAPTIRRRLFPIRAVVEFKHWAMFYHQNRATLEVQATAAVKLNDDEHRVVEADCTAAISETVYVLQAERQVGRSFIDQRNLVFRFWAGGEISFGPGPRPRMGRVTVKLHLADGNAAEATREIPLTFT
jgi:hypothetical protein